MADPILVVGASLAGFKAVKELRTLGFHGSITLVGDEPYPPYDRPPLSKGYLTGACDAAEVALSSRTELADLGTDLVLGARAVSLDRATRRVLLDDGRDLPYGRLLVTTGARARRLPWYRDLPGLHLLRSLDDADGIRSGLRGGGPVIVVGGGFIGTEAAAVLAAAARRVTLVAEFATVLAPLGSHVSGMITDMHRERGVEVIGGRRVVAVDGHDRVEGVTLDDGRRLAAPLVLVATGARPNSEWLGGDTDPSTGAVRTDPAGRVAEHVWAAGDVTTSGAGHWFGAVRQARRAARGLLGVHDAVTDRLDSELPYFWTDQFDLKVQVVGTPHGAVAVPVLHEDGPSPRIVELYERAGRVVGVLAAGRPRDLGAARAAVRDGDDVDTARSRFVTATATAHR